MIAPVLRNGDKQMREGDKEPQKVKSIINKANSDRHIKDLKNQPWVGKSEGIFWINCFIKNSPSWLKIYLYFINLFRVATHKKGNQLCNNNNNINSNDDNNNDITGYNNNNNNKEYGWQNHEYQHYYVPFPIS